MFNTRYLDKLLALNTAKNTMKRGWTDIGERDCLKFKCNGEEIVARPWAFKNF